MLTRMASAGLSRRAVLVAALIVPLAAACSGGTAPDPSPTAEDQDIALRARIADQEAQLIAAYESAISRFPELADDLTPILEQHRAHRTALGSAGSSPSPSPAASSAAEALAVLAAAESSASDACTTACVKSVGADTARLVALIAASEESHVPYLDGIVL
jgi:hypothetical protein